MEKGRKWAYRWVLQNEPTVGGRCIYLSCSFLGMIPIKRKGFLCVCLYHEAHMWIWCVCVVKTFLYFFVVGIFLIFFRLHWNPENIPWQEHISGNFWPLWNLRFFIHVCIPVQIYLYSCIFQWLLLKTSFVETHTCFFWTDVQGYTSPLACVSVILSHARNIHSVPDFSDCKREYFTLPSFKTQNVSRCMYSLSNTVVMFCQM